MTIYPFPMAVAILLCLSMLTGCLNDTPGSKNIESANKAENSFDIDGVKLNNGSVELTLAPGVDGIQGIENFLITNTKQIMVSTDASLDDAIIEVFLYSAESKDEPIAFAKISSETKKVVFANLTSSAAYKVAACYNGPSKPDHPCQNTREHGILSRQRKERIPWHTDSTQRSTRRRSSLRFSRGRKSWARSHRRTT